MPGWGRTAPTPVAPCAAGPHAPTHPGSPLGGGAAPRGRNGRAGGRPPPDDAPPTPRPATPTYTLPNAPRAPLPYTPPPYRPSKGHA
ncbi:hypothetical protein GCM10018773_02780 [Streptomyces candidus]|nr:hypothetical protein GCM10018773_02780 [Streptomyces candidus]